MKCGLNEGKQQFLFLVSDIDIMGINSFQTPITPNSDSIRAYPPVPSDIYTLQAVITAIFTEAIDIGTDRLRPGYV